MSSRACSTFYCNLRCASVLSAALLAASANAAVPAPANDTPASAEPIGPLPAVHYGTNVNGTDANGTTTLTGLTSVPGPDVFYTFTPDTTGDYWIMMIPWQEVPVYASSGATVPVPNLCVYIRDVVADTYVAGSDANFRGQPDTVVAALTAGRTYEIAIDSRETAPRAQEFEFTLLVAGAPVASAEDCFSGAAISASLPTVVVGTLSGAVDDITFVEGGGRCDLAYSVAVAGADHVYTFTTGPDPGDAGDYVFDLVPAGATWDGYLYVTDSCPPFFPLGCLGAANHAFGGARQAETLVVTLDYDTTYYVVIDAASFFLSDAKYALVVDRAPGYDVSESEFNDIAAEAAPLLPGPNGGQLVGPDDVDWWALPALDGEKLYVFVDQGNAGLSTIDSELGLYAPDGMSLIEFDDNDGEGSESPWANFTWRTSSFSPTVAGVPAFADGDHLLRIAPAAVGTVSRYRVHYGRQPAGRTPAPECEPNNEADLADLSAKDYFAGTISVAGDVDTFLFDADAGDRVYIALDGDPERDSGGDDADDPFALDAALVVLDPEGDVLIARHDDHSGVEAEQIPDFPAEALYFAAPLAGTYAVQVSGSDEDDYGGDRTYELAIFRNDAAPDLGEDTDPEIDSFTPNFQTDSVLVEASDDAPGDSGLCAAMLAPGSVNLAITDLLLDPGDPTTAFHVGLVNPAASGSGKLIITDCAGNTVCAAVQIDASAPICSGNAVTPGGRSFHYEGDPIHVPDNQPGGPGIHGDIPVALAGTVQDVNVTLTIESSRVPDIAAYLLSPAGTTVELIYQAGSVSDYDITDATFDDDADEPLSFFGDEPYTGRWLPSDPFGLAQLNGESVAGTWRLNVIDTSSSSSGGSRLVDWSLEIDAGFDNPETFVGSASDTGGLATLELVDADNVQLNVPDTFTPGDLTVAYTVTLVNPAENGSGRVVVTDVSDNTCESLVSLQGLPDATAPAVAYETTRDLVFGAEAQLEVPISDPQGVSSTFEVPDDILVSTVIADLVISTRDVGRLTATLNHDGALASLINRVGMDERGSVGLTKDNLEIRLDDDAPVADDAHLEPALGSISFLGRHQPDGRGEYIGDAIDTDDRDNMMFALEGLASGGTWDLYVADLRNRPSYGVRSIFRRWQAIVVSPGAPERLTGVARDRYPEAGLCEIALADGATNLTVSADFATLAQEVSFLVTLVDPTQPGSGTLEISDCAGNVRQIPVDLAPAAADQNLPALSGAVNPTTHVFEGTATDNAPGDSGIATFELAPYADNLEILSVDPTPPGGAASVSFTVGLLDPGVNGRGYVRVTDVTGYRRHILVEIDAQGPVCSGSVGHTKRYRSGPELPAPIPDDSAVGASSNILVPDPDRIEDLDITFNITHPMDADIDMTLSSPNFIELFTDVGFTGNDFIDVTLDDEAELPITDNFAEAPFTGSWQPEPPASLSILYSNPAAGTYTLKVVDDAVYNTGTFDNWSLLITASDFPERYDGRAEDSVRFDSGLCSIALAPGSTNLTLDAEPFTPGAQIVRYSVALANPALDGWGEVAVTDCAGNTCTVPLCLTAMMPPARLGDLDGDSVVNFDDLALFAPCINGPGALQQPACDPCRLADFDLDQDADLHDLAAFQAALDPQ